MSSATLLAGGILALATAAGFAYVARLMLRLTRERGDQSALVMFSLFWTSAAIVWTTQGIVNVAAAFGRADLALVSALDQVGTPFYCLAAAGVLYYVLYLLTGKRAFLAPILGYYLALFFALRWRVESAGRMGVSVERWVVNFDYATPLQGTTYTILVALVALPILMSIVMYASLLRRIQDPGQRYRVLLVSIGLAAWVTTEALSFTSGFARTDAGEVLRRLVALGSTIVIIVGYRPPRFARERWRAVPLE